MLRIVKVLIDTSFCSILMLCLAQADRLRVPMATTGADFGAPIAISQEGVNNLYQITALIYRSAQPSAKGMQSLEAMGIDTVLNLRSFHRDDALLQDTRLHAIRIPLHAWDVDEDEEDKLIAALQLLNNTKTPILVHCQHGSDRTGTIIALYRMVIQNWSKEQAIAEMIQPKFGFHGVWKNIIRYLNRVDVVSMREKVLAAK